MNSFQPPYEESIASNEGQSHRADSRKAPRVRASILDPGPLSPREAGVLRFLAEGLSKKQIAHRVNRSIKTIDAQLDAAYKKLGAHSATHALGIAITKGIVGLTLLCLLVVSIQADRTMIRPRGPARQGRVTSARTTRRRETDGGGTDTELASDFAGSAGGGAGVVVFLKPRAAAVVGGDTRPAA
jgi:DNA-binding CsgD family transcriptional regulator